MENQPRYRSLFWPILLIGVGIIWLLSNLGIIQPINLGSLLQFWPLILIILGIDIMFSRRFPWIGAVVGFLAVAGVIAFLVMSPSLGVQPGAQTKTEVFSAPVDGATTAEYYFETSAEPVEINVADSSSDLIVAELTHRGTINFTATGTTHKKVSLSENFDNSTWLNWDFSFDHLKWDIELAQDVPSEIILNGGSGSIKMDLSDLVLTSLRADLGSGSSQMVLPESDEVYTFELESGSGSVNVDVPENAALEMTLDSGSGSINISIPDGAALRIEVFDDGSGSLSLPNDLEKAPDSSSFSIGAWQTEGYDNAEHQILIQIKEQGSGSVSIH